MAVVAYVFKAGQAVGFLGCTDFQAAWALPAWCWVVLVVLVLLGQHLNSMVYARLGHDGVFYGSRFGKKLPWVTAYPYSVLRDPQFVGALTSLAGAAFVLPSAPLLFWASNYLYLMWLESSVPDGQ